VRETGKKSFGLAQKAFFVKEDSVKQIPESQITAWAE